MKKIKDKKNQILHYQHFLKNNNLKKKNQIKNNLFKNLIYIKNKNFILTEFNQNESIFLPNIYPLNKDNIIYTIQKEYKKNLLINYSLNYNLIYYFTKNIFRNYIKKKGLIIKGRILNTKKKKVLISFFGLILKMKTKNLHKNRKFFYIRKMKFKKN